MGWGGAGERGRRGRRREGWVARLIAGGRVLNNGVGGGVRDVLEVRWWVQRVGQGLWEVGEEARSRGGAGGGTNEGSHGWQGELDGRGAICPGLGGG